jgi:glycosyltransferase involved in cell wall biosynthesis
MSLDISVIIPAYNEEERIAPTIHQLSEFLSASELRYELLVVDDGSSDDTMVVVEGLASEIPHLRWIRTRPNRGKGSAVRVGMLCARGRVRLMTDADGSTPATEIPALVNPIRLGETDIAIGSRYADGSSVSQKQPFYRRWWSRLANQVVQAALVPGVADTQCGFKAFSAEAADTIFRRTRIDGWAFDLEALALARRMGFEVLEIPVHWSDDPRSKINPLGDAWRVFKEMLTIRRNLRRRVYGRLGPAHDPGASLTELPRLS